VIHPPSHDPATGDKLKWWENIPILSWVMLRGKSRYTGKRISVQYPLVEAFTMVMFAAVFLLYYVWEVRPGFFTHGLLDTWPVLLAHLCLVGCLIAATVIDFKLYIIPLEICWTATLVAMIVLPLSVGMQWAVMDTRFVPMVDGQWGVAGLGALVGWLIALGLLWKGVIPRSFADEMELTQNEDADENAPHTWLAYPHPRREICKELLFLLPIVLGFAVGYFLGGQISWDWPSWLGVLMGCWMGYLVGGGLIWATRIFGTLAFGKEAMGLGDVHLLAAIGAVVGAGDSVFIFFLAPFAGIVGALISAGMAAIVSGKVRVIPYGPYLALAAVVMMVIREPVMTIFDTLMLRP